MKSFPTHDPLAKLDYEVDWTAWLRPGETIIASTWAITPTGPTLSGDAVDGGKAGVWLHGLVKGFFYTLTNHIVTSQGREDDRSGTVHCDDR